MPFPLEMLRQLALGRTDRQIGAALHVSEETVKTHVGNILSKLQLGHRTQAVVYALKQGLIFLDEIDSPRKGGGLEVSIRGSIGTGDPWS